MEVADQAGYLTLSQYADTGPTSPSRECVFRGGERGEERERGGGERGGGGRETEIER